MHTVWKYPRPVMYGLILRVIWMNVLHALWVLPLHNALQCLALPSHVYLSETPSGSSSQDIPATQMSSSSAFSAFSEGFSSSSAGKNWLSAGAPQEETKMHWSLQQPIPSVGYTVWSTQMFRVTTNTLGSSLGSAQTHIITHDAHYRRAQSPIYVIIVIVIVTIIIIILIIIIIIILILIIIIIIILILNLRLRKLIAIECNWKYLI